MEAEADGVAEKVQSLSDLELALLICLVPEQHCVIECEVESLRGVQVELELVGLSLFLDECVGGGRRKDGLEGGMCSELTEV